MLKSVSLQLTILTIDQSTLSLLISLTLSKKNVQKNLQQSNKKLIKHTSWLNDLIVVTKLGGQRASSANSHRCLNNIMIGFRVLLCNGGTSFCSTNHAPSHSKHVRLFLSWDNWNHYIMSYFWTEVIFLFFLAFHILCTGLKASALSLLIMHEVLVLVGWQGWTVTFISLPYGKPYPPLPNLFLSTKDINGA